MLTIKVNFVLLQFDYLEFIGQTKLNNIVNYFKKQYSSLILNNINGPKLNLIEMTKKISQLKIKIIKAK